MSYVIEFCTAKTGKWQFHSGAWASRDNARDHMASLKRTYVGQRFRVALDRATVKPGSVWLVESQNPNGVWVPDLDLRPCRTRALAEVEARYQGGGALKGLVRYRVAKYVRVP